MKKIYFTLPYRRSKKTVRLEYGQIKKKFIVKTFDAEINGRMNSYDSHKEEIIDLAKRLLKLNFNLCGTEGTANEIKKNGIKCKKINKVSGGTPHMVDVLNSNKIALVINTGGGKRKHRVSDARALRRATLINKVPYCTNMSTAYACLEAIQSLKNKKLKVKSLQEN